MILALILAGLALAQPDCHIEGQVWNAPCDYKGFKTFNLEITDRASEFPVIHRPGEPIYLDITDTPSEQGSVLMDLSTAQIGTITIPNSIPGTTLQLLPGTTWAVPQATLEWRGTNYGDGCNTCDCSSGMCICTAMACLTPPGRSDQNDCNDALWTVVRDAIDVLSGRYIRIKPTLQRALDACE